MRAFPALAVLTFIPALSSCGYYTPEMTHSSAPEKPGQTTAEANFRRDLITHVECELSLGILRAFQVDGASKTLAWLKQYQALATFTLTGEDQSTLNPGAIFTSPLGGVQTFSFAAGASAGANATRAEAIQLSFPDGWLYENAAKNKALDQLNCSASHRGVMVESDLKIADFVYNNALVASHEVDPNKTANKSPLLTFQYHATFVATYSGNLTPTWKLTRTSYNSTSNLLSGTRTNTNDILITIGPTSDQTKSLHSNTLIGISSGQSVRTQGQ